VRHWRTCGIFAWVKAWPFLVDEMLVATEWYGAAVLVQKSAHASISQYASTSG
jgi:hypothetical protein